MKNFRPISMVGCVYKVIAKILSRRLKGMMGVWLVKLNRPLFKGGRSLMVC